MSKPATVATRVPLEITEGDLLTYLQQVYPFITGIHRIIAKATNAPTRKVRVFTDTTEQATTLTKHGLTINGNHHKAEAPHVRRAPMRCFNCQGYGHPAKSCDRNTRCPICADSHDRDSECSRPPSCANCGKGHSAFSKECQTWKAQVISNRRATKFTTEADHDSLKQEVIMLRDRVAALEATLSAIHAKKQATDSHSKTWETYKRKAAHTQKTQPPQTPKKKKGPAKQSSTPPTKSAQQAKPTMGPAKPTLGNSPTGQKSQRIAAASKQIRSIITSEDKSNSTDPLIASLKSLTDLQKQLTPTATTSTDPTSDMSATTTQLQHAAPELKNRFDALLTDASTDA